MVLFLASCAGGLPFVNDKPAEEPQKVVAEPKAKTPTKKTSKPKATVAPKLNIQLVADKGINVNALGQSSPVVVRVYQLKDLRQFDAIGFIDLYEDDGVLLQGSLVNIRELDPLAPGKSTRLQLPLYKATRYVAVMAAFSDYESGMPLDVIKVNSKRVSNLKIHLTGNKVKISPAK